MPQTDRSLSRYTARVPDTLDLAERARLGVNALVGIIDPQRNYQPNQCGRYYRNPPVQSIEPGGYVFVNGNEMWGKTVEALLEMRLMSGSEQSPEADEATLRGMVSCIEDDGLFYSYIRRVAGDELVESEDFSDLAGGARVVLGLLARYQLDGNEEWKEAAGRLVRGFIAFAIPKEDYAYYPDGHVGGAISRPRSGWQDNAEPAGHHESEVWYESASIVLFSYGGIVQALCQWYRITSDAQALDLAGKLVRFMLKPRFWQSQAESEGIISAQHGHYSGHIHATVRGLWGLLEYAVLTNDEQLKLFVRDGYEYTRTFGIARIGLFGEGCTVGDMTCLAVKLTDAGVGDYWEDVDQYVRNHLTELQVVEPEPVRQVAAASPAHAVRSWEDADHFVERTLGALCDDGTHPTSATLGSMWCCTYNGLIGFYHAWEAIVRCVGNVAQVNLLLHRASPWLDVDSYLPYEGKVVLHNKTARAAAVRVPRWVEKSSVVCRVNGRTVSPWWLDRRAMVEGLAGGEEIVLTFPVVERVEHYQIGWEGVKMPGWTEWTQPRHRELPPALTTYTLRFRGNTLVDISPQIDGLGYPLYRRDGLAAGASPLKDVERVISPRLIDL